MVVHSYLESHLFYFVITAKKGFSSCSFQVGVSKNWDCFLLLNAFIFIFFFFLKVFFIFIFSVLSISIVFLTVSPFVKFFVTKNFQTLEQLRWNCFRHLHCRLNSFSTWKTHNNKNKTKCKGRIDTGKGVF